MVPEKKDVWDLRVFSRKAWDFPARGLKPASRLWYLQVFSHICGVFIKMQEILLMEFRLRTLWFRSPCVFLETSTSIGVGACGTVSKKKTVGFFWGVVRSSFVVLPLWSIILLGRYRRFRRSFRTLMSRWFPWGFETEVAAKLMPWKDLTLKRRWKRCHVDVDLYHFTITLCIVLNICKCLWNGKFIINSSLPKGKTRFFELVPIIKAFRNSKLPNVPFFGLNRRVPSWYTASSFTVKMEQCHKMAFVPWLFLQVQQKSWNWEYLQKGPTICWWPWSSRHTRRFRWAFEVPRSGSCWSSCFGRRFSRTQPVEVGSFFPHYKNPCFTHWIHSILSLLFSSTGDISRVNLEFWSPWLQPRPRCLPRMLKKPKAPRFYCTNKRWRGPQGGAESSGKWPWSEFLG